MSENVESERGFFGGAAHAAGVAAETALHATGAAATAVIGTAEAAAENIADVATGMTGNAADLGRKIAHGAGRKLRRTTSIVGNQYARRFADRLSPVVEGMGGDFGDGDDDDPEARIVVLRVEIASSAEVKVIQWINYILTLFALLATVGPAGLQYCLL